jgi:hypothetical protein
MGGIFIILFYTWEGRGGSVCRVLHPENDLLFESMSILGNWKVSFYSCERMGSLHRVWHPENDFINLIVCQFLEMEGIYLEVRERHSKKKFIYHLTESHRCTQGEKGEGG